jgi:hypothetical protein
MEYMMGGFVMSLQPGGWVQYKHAMGPEESH